MSPVYLLQIFAIIILILFSILILTLVIPFQFSFNVLSEGTIYEAWIAFSILMGLMKASISFGPGRNLFRLFLFSIPIYNSTIDEEAEKDEEAEEKEEKHDDRSLFERIRSFTSSRGLLQPFVRVLKATLRHTHLKELEAIFKVGLPDPFQTGMLCALFYPLRQIYYSLTPVGSIEFTPVFTKEVYNISIRGRITLSIIMILIPVMRLFLKKDFRTLVRSARKKGKR